MSVTPSKRKDGEGSGVSDPNKLAAIADDLRKVAKDCANASHTLRLQAQQLDWTAQDLTIGTSKWAGKGSQSFLSAWNDYHRDTYRSCNELDQTAQALNKLAQTIEDNLQTLHDAQAKEIAAGIITGGLLLLDIVQLGLDPVTDAATVGAGGVDMALIEEAQAAEEVITEMDAQVSGELEEITSQIENSSEPGDVNVTDGGTNDGGSTDSGGGASGNGGKGGPRKTGGGGDDGDSSNGSNSSASGGWSRDITDTSQMDSNLPDQLQYRGTLSGGGRSGGARSFEGTPNSYVQTPSGHVFVYDGQGRLIYDISANRVKMTVWDEAPNGQFYPRDVKLTGPVPPAWLKLLP